MVADDDGAAFLGNALKPAVGHAVHRVRQEPHDETHGELRHAVEDVDRDADVDHRQQQEQLRYRAVQFGEPDDGEHGAHHHETGVEDVRRRDDACAPIFGGARLDERHQRHHVHAAEDAGQEQSEQHPKTPVARQKGRDTAQAGGVDGVDGEIDFDPHDADAEGGDRHQADLDPAPRKSFADQRTGADGDGEHGEDERDDARPARQVVPREIRNLREVDAPDEPEPGNAED